LTALAGWVAPRLGRAVLAVAVAALLLGIGLTALGVAVTSWPYRRVAGPSRRRAQVEAGLRLAQAAATLAAVLRPSPPREP
jgi:hypothetical protein